MCRDAGQMGGLRYHPTVEIRKLDNNENTKNSQESSLPCHPRGSDPNRDPRIGPRYRFAHPSHPKCRLAASAHSYRHLFDRDLPCPPIRTRMPQPGTAARLKLRAVAGTAAQLDKDPSPTRRRPTYRTCSRLAATARCGGTAAGW